MSAASTADSDDIIAAINVTPLVDIMLVLLIVFMLTTSMMQYPVVPVELPRATHAKDAPTKALNLVLDKDNRIFVNGTEKTKEETLEILKIEVKQNKDVNVILGADGNQQYKNVMTIIDMTKEAGVRNLGLNVQFANVMEAGSEL